VDARPTAGELLTLLGLPNPAAGRVPIGEWLRGERERFLEVRRAKHHRQVQVPAGFNADLDWGGNGAAAGPPRNLASAVPPAMLAPEITRPTEITQPPEITGPPTRPLHPPEQESWTRSFRRRRGD
jgi:hypothetical protein